jgi:hypothetical protein
MERKDMCNVIKIFGVFVQEIWISLKSPSNTMLGEYKMLNFDEILKSAPPMRRLAKKGA